MWNLISCSKITQQKIRQKSYDDHIKKLNKIKPKMKIQQPDQPWFIYAKKKKQLKRNQQLMDIQKHNHLLLSKIKSIQTRQNKTFKNPTFLTTLNSKVMYDTNTQIFKQNRRICQKLLKTETFYKTTNLIQNSNNLQRVMQNISTNSRRVQSAKSLMMRNRTERPQSSYTRRPMSSHPFSQYKQRLQSGQNSSSKQKLNSLTRPSSAPSIKKIKGKIENQNTQQNENKEYNNE